jgi:flagellar hook-length control protein FliK
MLAQALPSPALAAEVATAPVQAGVQAPLHGAAFAPELGARVSLLAVDGVQRAELQLNPSEMGPVSVQITVDGSQALVSFHAAQAETRAVLEQSLPELAAALQGQGLTLSGGGVFQQFSGDGPAGQARGEAGAMGETRGAPPGGAAGEPAPATAPARRTTGLLDTFA